MNHASPPPPNEPPLRALLVVALAGTLAAVLSLVPLAGRALPQYTARSGRNCANCHTEPTGWQNPELPDRLCTLSCSGCHVDPAGGGMRTVSGLFYGTQTLPAFAAPLRPWEDREPHLLGALPPRNAQDRFDPSRFAEFEERPSAPEDTVPASSQPSSQPASQPSSQPDDAGAPTTSGRTDHLISRAGSPVGSHETAPDGPLSDLLAWGQPIGTRSIHAFRHDRYGGLNADPLVRLGLDARYAAYGGEQGWTLFPMQLDLGVALHPVEHLTAFVEGAAWGSQTGIGSQVAGEDIDRFGLHEAFLMTHEWPFNAYLKIGRFTPQFGTRLDDHTAFVRRNLLLDSSRPSAWVSGVEAGFNANYPYVNVAAFRTGAGQHSFWPDAPGGGLAANAGWRDLAWGIGASTWTSGSPDENRTMVGANWYVNPWRWWPHFPFTYLGELDWVSVDRGEGRVQQLASFHELDWLPLNGVNLRLRYDFFDANLDGRDDHQHRINVQMDFFPVRFTELQFVFRRNLSPGSDGSSDFLLMARGWL